jgi:predicted Zn-ribbon and HTH transcriptional regulator
VYRKELITIMLNRPTGLKELAILLEEKVVDVEEDLRHLQKSLCNQPYRLHIEPARCNKCGFLFKKKCINRAIVPSARGAGSASR